MKQIINIFKEQDTEARRRQFTVKFIQAVNQAENTRPVGDRTGWKIDEDCGIMDLPEQTVRVKQ